MCKCTHLCQHMNVESNSRQSADDLHEVIAGENDGKGQQIAHDLLIQVGVQGHGHQNRESQGHGEQEQQVDYLFKQAKK